LTGSASATEKDMSRNPLYFASALPIMIGLLLLFFVPVAYSYWLYWCGEVALIGVGATGMMIAHHRSIPKR
jgi:hypothetical protein